MSNFSHNLQSISRLIAARSRNREYDEIKITERQARLVLYLLIDIFLETLSQPGGRISIEGLGVFESCRRAVAGALKRGKGIAEAIQHFTYTIRFNPSKKLNALLKKNFLRSR